MSQDKMREEFEAAYMAAFVGEDSKSLRNYWLSRRANGEYSSRQVIGAWWAWQASREAVVVELPEWFDRFDSGDRTYWADDVEKAIHAAGIRTK